MPLTSEREISQLQKGLERFLVCGLGSLGQHCVAALFEFGVRIVAIEQVPPQNWEIPHLPQLLDELIVGDCRQNQILEQAKIRQCRAVLVVTSSEEINAQTALVVRQLNPRVRLVVRSAQENLNQLLGQQLGNFFAQEPTQLTAAAFALAGLGEETIGFFTLDGQRLQVIKHQLKPGSPWCQNHRLHELNTRKRRLLAHLSGSTAWPQTFHQWESQARLLPGDTLIYLETVEQFSLSRTRPISSSRRKPPKWRESLGSFFGRLKAELSGLGRFTFLGQVKSLALACSLIVLVLLLVGTLLFQQYYPQTTWVYAFYATAILLLGGYSDLFGAFGPVAQIPWWLQLFALGLTVVGTAFVGVLYALLTETLLSAKFEWIRSRPPIPQQEHLVLVGLGRVGQGVATFLQQLKHPLVAIAVNADWERTLLPGIPLIGGNLKESLARANLASAKSVVIATGNEMLNLEIALMTKAINPQSHLVIGTYGQGLSEQLTHLLESAQVIGADEVAASAFAGAAFGENILSLFRLENQTILVTEYQIEAEDTLNGLLLAEVAYGYGVVVIEHQAPPQAALLMPSDDIRLKVGERIVVLATVDGLRRIEQGKIGLTSRCWRVRVERTLRPDAAFEGANAMARIAGCPLALARDLMNHLPQTLPTPLYKLQAQCLVRELRKVLVKADLVALSE